MAESFAYECEVILTLHRVDEDFMCFGAEREEFARRAHFDRSNLVRVRNLSHWSLLVDVPEKDRRSVTGCD